MKKCEIGLTRSNSRSCRFALTAEPTIQASAPPEAELYHGTDVLINDDNIPVAAAVPINEGPGPSTSGGSSSYHNEDPPHSNSNPVHQHAVTARPTGSQPLLAHHPVNDRQEVMYFTGLGLHRQRITCPHCHAEGPTNVRYVVDGFTIIAVGILFLLFWPICWAPLALPGCKVTEHYCSTCHRRVSWNLCFSFFEEFSLQQFL